MAQSLSGVVALVGLAGLLAALFYVSPTFVGTPVPRVPLVASNGFLEQEPEATQDMDAPSVASWATPLLSLGAALGLVAGIVGSAAPARAITAEQFSQLTYQQVRGSGLANRCPTVDQVGQKVSVKDGQKLVGVCFEPKSFAVEAETTTGKQFVKTKLMTRQTYSIEYIKGDLDTKDGNITFSEKDGMDFSAVTVKLPNGEYVPFLFTCKQLVAKGAGTDFRPGYTWGGEFEVPSYRTGGFLDPKGRGMYTGYDQGMALMGSVADGGAGQTEALKENNKVFDIGKGAIEMEINKVNEPLGEIGGVFVSKQPGDTDMGAKVPKTILIKGIFYGKVVNPEDVPGAY